MALLEMEILEILIQSFGNRNQLHSIQRDASRVHSSSSCSSCVDPAIVGHYSYYRTHVSCVDSDVADVYWRPFVSAHFFSILIHDLAVDVGAI